MPMKPLTKDQLDLINEYKLSKRKINDFCLTKNIHNYQLNYLLNKQRLLSTSNVDKFVSLPINETIKTDRLIENRNNIITFKLNDYFISISPKELKMFLEAIK